MLVDVVDNYQCIEVGGKDNGTASVLEDQSWEQWLSDNPSQLGFMSLLNEFSNVCTCPFVCMDLY